MPHLKTEKRKLPGFPLQSFAGWAGIPTSPPCQRPWSCGELTGDLKTNREISLTKHVGFVYAYAKKAKNININDEKGGDKQKKQES